jgi:predicted metalloprotease
MSARISCALALSLIATTLPALLCAATAPSATDALVGRVQQLFTATNNYWAREFVVLKASYVAPTLGFDAHALADGCSEGATVVGPFYCPDERRVYLSQDFLQQVRASAGSAADLALAYIVGHEVGKHIQALIGTTEQVEQARANSTAELSARTWTLAQLQADCYAGLWVRSGEAAGQIQPGEAARALNAVATASQAEQASLTGGQVRADPLLTYGTQAERLAWFHHGLDSGNFADCDTFAAQAAGQ